MKLFYFLLLWEKGTQKTCDYSQVSISFCICAKQLSHIENAMTLSLCLGRLISKFIFAVFSQQIKHLFSSLIFVRLMIFFSISTPPIKYIIQYLNLLLNKIFAAHKKSSRLFASFKFLYNFFFSNKSTPVG